MKRIFLIILIIICNHVFAQVDSKVRGKILDDKLNCLPGVRITNLNNGAEAISDQNGQYEISSSVNDTLEFRHVGLTIDKVFIANSIQFLKLIMLDKDVNCLGAEWTERQYRRANRQIDKQLEKLYKEADKQNKWGNSSC